MMSMEVDFNTYYTLFPESRMLAFWILLIVSTIAFLAFRLLLVKTPNGRILMYVATLIVVGVGLSVFTHESTQQGTIADLYLTTVSEVYVDDIDEYGRQIQDVDHVTLTLTKKEGTRYLPFELRDNLRVATVGTEGVLIWDGYILQCKLTREQLGDGLYDDIVEAMKNVHGESYQNPYDF